MCRMRVVSEVGGETNSVSDIEECETTVWSKQYHLGSKSLLSLPFHRSQKTLSCFLRLVSLSNDLPSIRLPSVASPLQTIVSSPRSSAPSPYSSLASSTSTSPPHPTVSCSHPNSTSLPCRLPFGCRRIGVHSSSSVVLPNTLPTVLPSPRSVSSTTPSTINLLHRLYFLFQLTLFLQQIAQLTLLYHALLNLTRCSAIVSFRRIDNVSTDGVIPLSPFLTSSKQR